MTFSNCRTSLSASCLHVSPFYCFFVWYRVSLILTLHWCNAWFIALAWASIIIRSPRKLQEIYAPISYVPQPSRLSDPQSSWFITSLVSWCRVSILALPLRWGIRLCSLDKVSCSPYLFGSKNNGWQKTALRGNKSKSPETSVNNNAEMRTWESMFIRLNESEEEANQKGNEFEMKKSASFYIIMYFFTYNLKYESLPLGGSDLNFLI